MTNCESTIDVIDIPQKPTPVDLTDSVIIATDEWKAYIAPATDFKWPQWDPWTDWTDWTNGTDWIDWIDWITPVVEVWTTTTLAPWSSATVTNTWIAPNVVLNFWIPKGADGAGWWWDMLKSVYDPELLEERVAFKSELDSEILNINNEIDWINTSIWNINTEILNINNEISTINSELDWKLDSNQSPNSLIYFDDFWEPMPLNYTTTDAGKAVIIRNVSGEIKPILEAPTVDVLWLTETQNVAGEDFFLLAKPLQWNRKVSAVNALRGANRVDLRAGENLTAGDAVYVSSGTADWRTAGRVYRTDPSNANRIKFIWFALDNITSWSIWIINVSGVNLRNGLTDNADYYLSWIGTISNTIPTTGAIFTVHVWRANSRWLLINTFWAAPDNNITNFNLSITSWNNASSPTYRAGETAMVTFAAQIMYVITAYGQLRLLESTDWTNWSVLIEVQGSIQASFVSWWIGYLATGMTATLRAGRYYKTDWVNPAGSGQNMNLTLKQYTRLY